MRLFGCHLRSWHAVPWLISVWYDSWAERFNRWLGCCISYVTTIVNFGGVTTQIVEIYLEVDANVYIPRFA